MKNDSFKKITISLMFGMIVLFLITFVNALCNNNNIIKINKFDRITIQREDGTVEYYNTNIFKKSNKGDIITAEFTLPEKPGNGHYSIFSHQYNFVLTISFKDEILFTYGEELAEKGHETGHVFVCADIPDEAWGKTITAQFKDMDYSHEHSLIPFEIYKTSQKEKYIFNGSAIPYFVYVMFVVLCFIILIPLILFFRKSANRLEGVFLMIFCLNTTIWGMGYQRMLFLTYQNNMITCEIEYIAIFAIPASYSIFMYLIGHGKLYRKIMLIYSVVSSVYFITATVLNYTTHNFHYCRLLTPVHVLILFGITIMLIHYAREKNVSTFQEKSVRIGSMIFLAFISIDFIVYFLNFYGYVNINVLFVPFGLFSFLLTIFISYLMNVIDIMMTVKEQERLQKMAYTDGMTGISNRRACLEFINNLNDFKENYGIVFFDVNNLKTANDNYSHDLGDKLICSCARVISESFDKDCFCGRYGGDEFIACIKGFGDSECEILKRLDIFKAKISSINKQEEFPFEVSIAYGYATSTGSPGKTSEEIVSIADREMYKHKTTMKKSR